MYYSVFGYKLGKICKKFCTGIHIKTVVGTPLPNAKFWTFKDFEPSKNEKKVYLSGFCIYCLH